MSKSIDIKPFEIVKKELTGSNMGFHTFPVELNMFKVFLDQFLCGVHSVEQIQLSIDQSIAKARKDKIVQHLYEHKDARNIHHISNGCGILLGETVLLLDSLIVQRIIEASSDYEDGLVRYRLL
jgi:hypothetical protein